MSFYQHTIAQPFSVTGTGLHSGAPATVTVLPAPPETGRYFVCSGCVVPARITTVAASLLSTQLQTEQAAIRTVEHLLAALSGMGIDNARIEVDSAEIPILDGSALPWVEAITKAGIVEQSAPRRHVRLDQPITLHQGDSFIAAFPAAYLRFSYGIEFPTKAITLQWLTWSFEFGDFAQEIAPARTFTMAEQVEQLRSLGLIKGGSLDNAIVCDQDGWLNPPLRFSDEPCRHKILDLIGDLSLLEFIPQAHIVAFKASHALHTQLAQVLFNHYESLVVTN